MLKKLLGMKDGTTRIKGVVGQFEGMIAELDSGAAMNNDKIAGNTVEIDVLEVENNELSDVNIQARNVKNGLLAIINGG